MMAETKSMSGTGRQGAGYWEESARPLVSLAFIAPFLVVYEIGVLWLGSTALHNGAAVWLKRLLSLAGFGQFFLLPVCVCGILLAWHHVARQRWKVSLGVLAGMSVETTLLALMLLGVARLQSSLFGTLHLFIPCSISGRELVSYCGAGIYEELLFRLMLLPTVAGMFRLAGAAHVRSFAAAAILTSLVFALAHYRMMVGSGDDFQWFSFLFRFLAGSFFAVLFLYRGFGIAAGSHAIYDVLASIVA